MRIEPNRNYAVVTGDIVGSSDLTAPERRQLPDLLHVTGAKLREWLGEEAVSELAVFGGDSWQILLDQPADSLRAALFVRASMLASPVDIDTRMAIAVGGVDFVPAGRIEEADGEAFRLSGRLLESLSKEGRGIGFAHPNEQVARQWDLVCRLVDALIRTNWTENRARSVTRALRGLTLEAIGKLWPTAISKQTVSRHLAEAGWDAVSEAISTDFRDL